MIDDGFRLFPAQASTQARHVDLLFLFLLALATLFTVAIAGLIVYFSIKYRRGNLHVDRSTQPTGNLLLELTWTIIPFILSVGIFTWGAQLFFADNRPPGTALEIQSIGKQWMWKFQHPSGRREINELHVPLGRPVKLSLISQDVIHSFFVPVFRVKRDVLPGRYVNCWFEATRTGEFHLFCAEYCGTNHSRMTGRVVVMEPADFEAWLGGGVADESPAEAGKRLFEELRCAACHMPQTGLVRCPPLQNVFGHPVLLENDQTVIADEDYLRESILRPNAKIVKNYERLMPSFDGQLDEEQLMHLISYLKSLSTP